MILAQKRRLYHICGCSEVTLLVTSVKKHSKLCKKRYNITKVVCLSVQGSQARGDGLCFVAGGMKRGNDSVRDADGWVRPKNNLYLGGGGSLGRNTGSSHHRPVKVSRLGGV